MIVTGRNGTSWRVSLLELETPKTPMTWVDRMILAQFDEKLQQNLIDDNTIIINENKVYLKPSDIPKDGQRIEEGQS